MLLSSALQGSLHDLEVLVAANARTALSGHGVADGSDLLIVDGPLRGRTHLPRALGFIKSHRTAYLPPDLHAMVAHLAPGERTPVFLMGSSWDRHAWYLRLPCTPGPRGPGWSAWNAPPMFLAMRRWLWPTFHNAFCRGTPAASTRTRGPRRTSSRSPVWNGSCAAAWATRRSWPGPCVPQRLPDRSRPLLQGGRPMTGLSGGFLAEVA